MMFSVVSKRSRRPAAYVVVLALLWLCSAAAQAAAPVGSWWNTNFAYRYKISLPAGASPIPSGYSVAISFNHAAEVVAGRSLTNGDDVRIVRWTGSAWAEVNRIADPVATWNTATTQVWFATQATINAGVTNDDYYVYYGDTGAPGTPLENGESVFLLYDEFNGNSLAPGRWNSSGSISVTGDELTVFRDGRVQSDTTYGLNTMWEARVRMSAQLPNGSGHYYYWGAANTTGYSDDDIGFHANSTDHNAESRVNNTGPSVALAEGDVTAYQTFAIARDSTSAVRFWINGAINGTPATSIISSVPVNNFYVALYNDSVSNSKHQFYDWARVRRYRNPEPVPTLDTLEAFAMPAPIAEWRLDELNWTSTAGEILDSSASGLHGRSYNGATTSDTTPARPGNPGTCRYGQFDGSNDYVTVADSNTLDLANQVTATAWVYPRAYGSEYKTIVSKDTNFEFHLASNGRIYWWWGGGSAELTSTTTVPLNQWSHIAISYQSGAQRLYINGVLRGVGTNVGTLDVNSNPLHIGQDQNYAGRWFNGYIDEVRVYDAALNAAQINTIYTATHGCTTNASHFVITHDRYGINCIVEPVTVSVRDASNNPITTYTQQITLNTTTGKGTWSLTSGTGSLSDPAPNDGIATYTFASGQSSAIFGLSYPEGARTFNIDVAQTSDTSIDDDESEGTLTFSQSGFVLTSTAHAPSTLPSFAAQTAGTNVTVHIAAYGTTPNDTQCGIIEAYTGVKPVKFWMAYANPVAGTIAASIDGTAVPLAVGASRNVSFVNGQAEVTAKYKDAGAIRLSARDDSETHPDLPNGTEGSTGPIVFKPAGFSISATSAFGTNPAAANAGGGIFIAAGRPFSLTVTARDAESDTTPNFGREIISEGVELVQTLIAPTGGANPSAGPTSFSNFINGAQTRSNAFSWPEVGILGFTPRVADNDYLGAGPVTGAAQNVGRFIPFNFAVNTLVAPSLRPACGQFSYVGQPLVYQLSPIVELTPQAIVNSVPATYVAVTNYRGSFMKVANTSLNSREYSIAGGHTLDLSGLPSSATDPSISEAGGKALLGFSLGSGLSVQRFAPVPAFDAEVGLQINIADSDGVLPANGNPFVVANPIAFVGGFGSQRYGRLALGNALGSELVNLPMPLRTQYYASHAAGFVNSTTDSCTSGVQTDFVTSSYVGNLQSGDTCVLDTGSPGVSAEGCPAVASNPYRSTAVLGDFNLILRAPGAGNDGALRITVPPATIPTWLQYDWNGAAGGTPGPTGIATFGIFEGSQRRIYQREQVR